MCRVLQLCRCAEDRTGVTKVAPGKAFFVCDAEDALLEGKVTTRCV